MWSLDVFGNDLLVKQGNTVVYSLFVLWSMF